MASAALRSPRTGVIFLVAEETVELRLVGLLLARTVAEEGEILNLAVRPDSRCRGIGRRLLAAGLERAAESGARRCWLEVRASNSTALLFYRRLGFAEQYRRPGYYREPDEAAVVCASSLPARRAAS
jgi:ribosomal-protein-alanine N-acetyltransferase